MERKVSVYPFPFGTRVFMHRNGVIREAEYRGMRIKDTGICGNNVDTEHIKTGCDLIILGGTNCDEGSMDWLFGSLGNENFYVCQPVSFYKSQREIQKVNPLYAFKVATAYFREQGKVPVFEDSNCRLIKL